MGNRTIVRVLCKAVPLSLLGALLFVAVPDRSARAMNTLVVGGAGNYTTIQAAVDDAEDGDTIEVNEGTWAGFDLRGNSDTDGLDITIIAVGDKEDTIIDSQCELTGRENPAFRISGFTFEGDPDATPDPIIAGIVALHLGGEDAEGIIDNCDFIKCHYDWHGGAITGFAGAINDCYFEECTSDQDGGAIKGASGSTVDNCTFVRCEASNGGALRDVDTVRNSTFESCKATDDEGDGGAMLAVGSSIENCVFESCEAEQDGGAVFDCDVDITRCTFRDNRAGRHGGAMALCDGDVVNCLVYANQAVEHGGGFYDCDGDVLHCTIVKNQAGKKGGGLRDCNGVIRNNIIWKNAATNGGAKLSNCSNPSYCCINGGFAAGTKIRTGNPEFTDYDNVLTNWADWDLTLGNGSSCLDKGKDGDATTDILGVANSRPVDLAGLGEADNNDADIGAYEAQTAP